ncbi:hypothetical protein [Spirosoma sordidisoli]|uniref:Uncharacterized protein n=1 Tax=Spirosoma sordidisoli TaxID=2502893 RepID=A0A4Q2UL86_9BACT|nr:hypothetical protein [Spirosoma sordidisoli]RYC70074.1 hypothetical protein EQG79_09390 [Spirosoma sordidisoli]
MKGYLLLISVCSLSLCNNIAIGQVQKTQEAFPSYDQIKPLKGERTDYGGLDSIVRVERKSINLFDYPAGTVTYLLNGKSLTDVKYIKQIVSDKRKDIDSISIGEPDKKGKRVIKIDYNLP